MGMTNDTGWQRLAGKAKEQWRSFTRRSASGPGMSVVIWPDKHFGSTVGKAALDCAVAPQTSSVLQRE